VRGQFINDGFALAGKLYQCLDIIELPRYLTIEFETFFEAGALLKDLAGAFLIGPEIGFRDLLLQLVELMLFRAGVKETSARPRCEFSID
jgi:hypothetical protein